MSTVEAPFYDRVMISPDSPAMLPLEDSPWRPMYEEAARWIPVPHDVVDLGCGTGRFLQELVRTDHYGVLTGVDFSTSALAEAAVYTDGKATFEPADLRTWQPDPERAGNTSYTCLEVLEHLDDDLDLISRVPPGHQLVMSLPSYESEAHLRWFPSIGSIWHRYASLLHFKRWSLIELDERKVIHVLDARRRTDSW